MCHEHLYTSGTGNLRVEWKKIREVGRPKTIAANAMETVGEVINEDRRQILREIAVVTGVSKSSVHQVL